MKSFIFSLLFLSFAFARPLIEPPSWWVGMKNPNLQLLIHADNISETQVSLSYEGVSLQQTRLLENPNYLILDLRIGPMAKPGSFPIQFIKNGDVFATYDFHLHARKRAPETYPGFDASDVLYLLYPDRFANGDPTNDNIATLRDQTGRDKPDGRHGGDLQGIIDHANYLQNLGVTALWLNPPQVNDMQYTSYHGYAITDHYQIDPRLGSNELMRTLVDTFHQRKMKIVMDVVLNHCGSEHHIAKDPPAPDWFNQWPTYTQSSFRISAMSDPYASPADQQKMAGGWFAGVMPDFNQHNPLVMNYMTQNCIWWIEYAGLDGLRLDTQPFSFKEGVAEWARRIRQEYPNTNLVGEVWQYSPAQTAYWQADALNKDGYNSHMPSVTDFQLHDALKIAFGEEDGWETGMSRLYLLLGKDMVYPRPDMLLTFPDNHDDTRFYTAIGEHFDQWKMAMTFLLTTRGIPCLYYGTELLFTGLKENGDADLRKDFPGGWEDDERNAFTVEGRTEAENKAFDFLQKLLAYRKAQPALHHGQLEHYMPEGGVYVYFRYTEETKIMVILNNSPEAKEVDLGRFAASLEGWRGARDVMSGEKLKDLDKVDLEGKSGRVLELGR